MLSLELCWLSWGLVMEWELRQTWVSKAGSWLRDTCRPGARRPTSGQCSAELPWLAELSGSSPPSPHYARHIQIPLPSAYHWILSYRSQSYLLGFFGGTECVEGLIGGRPTAWDLTSRPRRLDRTDDNPGHTRRYTLAPEHIRNHVVRYESHALFDGGGLEGVDSGLSPIPPLHVISRLVQHSANTSPLLATGRNGQQEP